MIDPARTESSRLRAIFLSSPERTVASAMVLIAVCIVGLTGYCLWVFPTLRTWSGDGLLAALALVFVAMSYGLIGWFGLRWIERRKSRILRLSLPWGLGAGAMFALWMVGEYLIPHDNSQGAMVTLGIFGTFFVLLAASGFFATKNTRRLTTGAVAGLWTALIGSQLWVLSLFSVYLAFVGTAHEARFLEVDQTIADFERSGRPDLRAFIFSDYTGGAFFHSVLGALFGLFLGGLGGLAALAFTCPPAITPEAAIPAPCPQE
jgi:hypothetical protein